MTAILTTIVLMGIMSPGLAQQFISNGIFDMPCGFYNPACGTDWLAFNYRPICGTLASTGPFSKGAECVSAFNHYQSINDTFVLYDIVGQRLSDYLRIGIGTGTDLCMCFSLEDTKAVKNDFCFYLTPTGAVGVTDIYFANAQVQAGQKALPQCGDINTTSITSSLLAASALATASSSSSPATPTATPSPTPTSTSTSSADTNIFSTTSHQTGNVTDPSEQTAGLSPSLTIVAPPTVTISTTSNSSPGGPASVGIWLPILWIVAGLGIAFVFQRKKRELDLEKVEVLRLKQQSESLEARVKSLESGQVAIGYPL